MKNEKGKEKEERNFKIRIIIALISALIIVALTYFRFGQFYKQMGLVGWGFNVLLIAIFFGSFAFIFFMETINSFFEKKIKQGQELDEEERKKRYNAKVFWICFTLALFGTILYTWLNIDEYY